MRKMFAQETMTGGRRTPTVGFVLEKVLAKVTANVSAKVA